MLMDVTLLATLNLTINPSTLSSTDVTECDTYSWNGQTYTASGVYTFASTNANGCDSTATLNLTINKSFSVGVSSIGSATVCSGSTVTLNMSTYASAVNTYQWNDANGIISGEVTSTYIATVSGTYSLTVTTPAGCSATSSGLVVNIIDIAVPSGLFTDNIQLNKGTMNWSAVADAHHYDVRFRESGNIFLANIICFSKFNY